MTWAYHIEKISRKLQNLSWKNLKREYNLARLDKIENDMY